jgi:two-component system sensor histidine kinase/response regulator
MKWASQLPRKRPPTDRAEEILREHQLAIYKQTDRLFAALMIVQWLAGIAAALWLSPRTWAGAESRPHLHVWLAVLLGGAISAYPVALALLRPGMLYTRQVIAVGQMLTSALLIHLTGGRIETHFHVFGSLAFLAFYRDWRVLVPATIVVAADHFIRGAYWPQSVYGILTASPWRWVEHAAWVIFEDVVLVSGCVRSVREMRVHAERTADLEVSESRLAQAQQLALIGSWEWDIATGRATWSAEQFRMLGLAPGELEPSFFTYFEFVHPDDRSRVEHLVRRALESGESFDCEHRVIGENEAVRIVHARAHVVTTPRGERIKVVGTVQDITERRRAEDELREKSTALEHAAEGIARVDARGCYASVNLSYAAMLGYAPSELIGSEWQTTVAGDDLPAMNAAYAQMREYGKVETEARGLRKDGSVFHKEVVMIAVGDSHEALGHYCFVKDITERKRVAQELQQARDAALQTARLKAEFLANMSHEIRTPMNGVVGMTGLLLETNLDDEQREFAESIQSSGDGLLTVINDILDFSKIDAGKLTFETLDFDLRDAIEESVELLADTAHAKGVELLTWIAPDVPTRVQGDPGRLRQVLLNLVGNALKFTQCGEVAVRLSREAETDTHLVIRLAVHDTGIGVAADAQRTLFEAFTQADGSTTRKYGGTGLGLAISKRLVELMGGVIGVDSEPGRGSTFYFTAQLSKQPSGAERAVARLTSLRQLRVLLVDDNASNRTILHHQLAAWDMLAESASSGHEALEQLDRAAASGTPFALAILDMQMPGMNGLVLAAAIRAKPRLASIRLVMMTSGRLADGDTLRATGIARCLTKPVKQSQLFDCLATVMGGLAEPAGLAGRQSMTGDWKSPVVGGERRRGRVLVAEDNRVNQRVTLHQLRRLGYAADAVANGAEAIEALSHVPYDIVLMDCQMPELDGYAATAAIRQREGIGRHTPIIALTAHALQGDREKCLAAGMDDYLSKPVDCTELGAVLARWVPGSAQSIEKTGTDALTSPDAPSAEVLSPRA